MLKSSQSGALYRLLSWLSPSYPIGAFSYSHGLETAIEEGFVRDMASLDAWLRDIIELGAGRNDAIFLRAAYEASVDNDDTALAQAVDLAAAFQPTNELLLETTAQGRAFLDTTSAAWPTASLEKLRQVQPGRLALAMVVGVAAAGHKLPLSASLPWLLACLRRQSRFRRRPPHSAWADGRPAPHRSPWSPVIAGTADTVRGLQKTA